MAEIIAQLPSGTGWAVAGVILLLLFGTPAIASRETAKSKLWLFGAIARWIQERKQRSIENERQLAQTQAAVLRGEIAELRGWIEEDRQAHSAEIASLRADMAEERKLRRRVEAKLQAMLDESMDYIEWVTGWAREVIITAQQQGWHPPLPEWYSFHEWRDLRRGPMDDGDAT